MPYLLPRVKHYSSLSSGEHAPDYPRIAREIEHPVNGSVGGLAKYISRLTTAIAQLSTVPGVKCVRSSALGYFEIASFPSSQRRGGRDIK